MGMYWRMISINKDVAKLGCLWDDKQHYAHYIFHIAKAVAYIVWLNWCAMEPTRGQGIGVYELKGRIQMFLTQFIPKIHWGSGADPDRSLAQTHLARKWPG